MTGVKKFKKITALLLLVCFITVSFSQSVLAGIVSTTDLLDTQATQLEKQRIYELLARDDVRSQLIAMGVNPEDAVQRVATMTDREVQVFAQNMQELPAGGDVLSVLLILFLVLLFTDIMGWTDIFPFVNKPAKK